MCKLTYNVQKNQDIADVTDLNYRTWLLAKVRIHLEGIREDRTKVEFKLWTFYPTGPDKEGSAQCLYGIGGKGGYLRNTASANKTIKKEYHPHKLKKRNGIIKEWMRREKIDHVVVEVLVVDCKNFPHRNDTV